jgi:hypothetical protein
MMHWLGDVSQRNVSIGVIQIFYRHGYGVATRIPPEIRRLAVCAILTLVAVLR